MKEKALSKRGQISLGGLQATALTFIILVLVIAVGALVITNILPTIVSQGGGNLTVTTNDWSNATTRAPFNGTWNATYSGIQGLASMGQQTPLIALIIVMAFIIGLVIVAFGLQGGGGFA